MKHENENLKKQKSDDSNSLDPKFEINHSDFISSLKALIISIVEEELDKRLSENEKKEIQEENKDLIFYSVEEVCKLLKISRTSLYMYSHKKRSIRFQRIGRRILYSQKDVLEALTSIKRYERGI